MFAFKKNKKLLEMLEEYLSIARKTLNHFNVAIEYLIDT